MHEWCFMSMATAKLTEVMETLKTGLLLIFVWSHLLNLVVGFPRGGPETVCNDPYPHHHGVMKSEEPSPFQMSANQSVYEPGDVIEVKITGNEVLKGLQVAAHSTTGAWEVLYGEFIKYPNSLKAYKYYSSIVNCVTHNGTLSVNEVVLFWKAPLVSVGDLVLSATLVKDYYTFWANVTAVLTANEPAANGSVHESIMKNPGSFDSELDVDSCGTTSGCVVYPNGCGGETCKFAASYKMVDAGDGIRFRLTSRNAPKSASYIALGISEDTWMGLDETFTCMDIGGLLNFAQGYNPSQRNIKVRSNTVRDIAVQSVDGAISCEFTRDVSGYIEVIGRRGLENITFKYAEGVNSPNHHLYLAWGTPYYGAQETVEKHEELPIVSKNKVAFGSSTKGTFYYLHDTVKVHVTFMVVAWFGAAAIATIVSRYFKDGFMNAKDKLCGLKPWFQVHRSLAFLAGLLAAVAFILIFVHYMVLTEDHLLHAGFGIAVMALTVAQILAGLLRPGPDAGKRRTTFNWIHRIFGSVTYIMAAVTIFLGCQISYMNEVMHTIGTGLLAGMVAVQVLTALVMEILACIFKDGAGYDLETEARNGQTQDNDNPHELKIQEAPPTSHPIQLNRKYVVQFCVFGLYVCILVSLIVCFLTILWLYN